MSEVVNEINESGVMVVKLNRPESLNSLNYGLVTGAVSYTHLTLPTSAIV